MGRVKDCANYSINECVHYKSDKQLHEGLIQKCMFGVLYLTGVFTCPWMRSYPADSCMALCDQVSLRGFNPALLKPMIFTGNR